MIQSFGEGFQHLNNQVTALTRSNDQLRKALKRLNPKLAEDIERMEDEDRAKAEDEKVEKPAAELQPPPRRNGFRVKGT
jgi:predicted phage gp36 major capsid-like protein